LFLCWASGEIPHRIYRAIYHSFIAIGTPFDTTSVK